MQTQTLSSPRLSDIPFEAPHCFPGQIVVFYRDCNFDDPQPAMVYKQTERTVELGAFVRGAGEILSVPNARHRADPMLQNPDLQDAGAWDFSEEQQQIDRLTQAVQRLAQEVQTLKKK